MFQSKILQLLKTTSRVPCEITSNIGLPCRFWSNIETQNSKHTSENKVNIIFEGENPDKLYKKIEIEIRGNDKAVLESYSKFAHLAAQHLEIETEPEQVIPRPIHERWTLLRSAHIYKKHRVQYEIRTYYRILYFINLTGSTADTFLEYIQRNLPEGVAMKVTKTHLEGLPDSITNPVRENADLN